MSLKTIAKDTSRRLGERAEDPAREARRKIAGARRATMRSRHKAERAAQHGVFETRLAATRANLKTRTAAVKARARASQAGADTSGSKKMLGVAGLAGAASAFFFDPGQGARRRHETRDRVAGIARRTADRLRRRAEYPEPTVGAKVNAVPPTATNDQALADSV